MDASAVQFKSAACCALDIACASVAFACATFCVVALLSEMNLLHHRHRLHIAVH
jgi:hypothetical protein